VARQAIVIPIIAVVVAVCYYSWAFLMSDIHLARAHRLLDPPFGDWNSSAAEARSAIDYNAYNVLAYYKLANALASGERYDESLQACKKVMEIEPDYARIHAYTSSVYVGLGPDYYAPALAEALKQVKIDGLPGSYAQLSRVYEKMGDTRLALFSLRKGLAALKVAPDGDNQLWEVESSRLVGLQSSVYPSHDPAGDIEKYIPAGGNGAHMRLALGQYYLKKKDQLRAEAQLAAAVKLSPENTAALDYYGFVLFKGRQYAKALRIYQRELDILTRRSQLDQHYIGVLMNVAASYAKLGNMRSAVATWNQVTWQAPGSPQAQEAQRLVYNVR
jgi:tetratricopeptide (TPR) repeat protein